MKAKLKSFYRKDAFTKVFVFTVSGSDEELADYKSVKGNYYREDSTTKEPLFFSSSTNGVTLGGSIELIKNYDGNDYIVDNTANEIQREMQIEQRMLDLEAQERFNRMKYGNNINFATGEVVEQVEEMPAVEPTEA